MDQLQRLQTEAFRELTENILPFSMSWVADAEYGGFYGYLSNDRAVRKEAPKALVQHSRMLWTFSQAARVLGDLPYRPTADHARKALMDWFWDAEHGGFFWMVDFQGRPLQTDKVTYGQAFCIYALAECFLAGAHPECLERAVHVYRALLEQCHDPEHGGYFEGRRADWTPASGLRVDETSLPVVKSMNTHLHTLEAYTTLLRAWEDGALRASLREAVDIFLHRLLDPNTYHLSLFFDRQWRSLSDTVSYGHDIEGSWLLMEAADVLGDAQLLAEAQEAALAMAYATLDEGLDADGGLCSEGDPSGVTDRTKVWWPQAEAVVGFLNAYSLNGDQRFLEASLSAWSFIQNHIVDRKHGDWFWAVDEAGRPLDREKAGPWKAPYHSGRMCLEILRRTPKCEGGA
jgi:mannobiose 2-epimerase